MKNSQNKEDEAASSCLRTKRTFGETSRNRFASEGLNQEGNHVRPEFVRRHSEYFHAKMFCTYQSACRGQMQTSLLL